MEVSNKQIEFCRNCDFFIYPKGCRFNIYNYNIPVCLTKTEYYNLSDEDE